MAVTSTPVWHDIFRKVTLKPDNITLEAEKIDDTLNIVRGPGVNFGAAAVGTGIDLSGGDGYAVIVVGGSTVESYT